MRFRLSRTVRLGVLFGIAATVAVPVALAGAASEVTPLSPPPSAENGQLTAEVPNAWFVELEEKPTATGGNSAAVKAEKQAFRTAAKSAGVEYTERFAFDTLWNGFSLEVGSADAGKLVALDGVKAVYPVATIPIPETTTADPDLVTAIAMTGADIAQDELGLDGSGVRVAVMDTGIDVDHPDLGGDGDAAAPQSFPNSRIVAGWDLVGDDFNANPGDTAYSPTPVPDPVPDDCNSHGTHVAGIVGANGDIVGVAPGVTFGAYRVFGCAGSTTADIMIAAMERALADDMDILNMSIGAAFNTWPQYPTAAASDALVDTGMVVIASIGNSGANGVYSAGAPGVGTKVTGVASYDNSHVSALTFDTPGMTGVAYLPISRVPPPPTSGTVPNPIVFVGRGCNADTYLADPNGKIALVVRGSCTFNEKYQRAVAAGAVGVIIHNSSTGLFAGGGVTPVADKFLVGISLADGLALRALPPEGLASLTWTSNRINAPNPTGGLISSFSSYGLNAELDLKPDIGAPGGLIRSTYPLELGGAAIISGTSMSSPHVAGAAALFLEAHPDTPPLALRSILQNSADPKNWSLNPGLGFLDNVHRQGAGMLDIDDAIEETTRITPGKLALGESQAGPQTKTLTLQNSDSSEVSYTLSHVGALGTHGSTNVPSFNASFATVGFSSASVTVPAGGSASVTATITAPAGPDKGQYGGYLVFTPQGGDGAVLRVPYAGLVGDYQSIQVLTGGPTFPNLARLSSCTPPELLRGLDCFGVGSYTLLPAGGTFNLTNAIGQTPNLLIHFEHQARRMEVEVLKANGQKVHPVFSNIMEIDFLPRNSTSTSFFSFPWDGTRMHDRGRGTADHRKVVRDGQYKLVVKVLKALGNPGNPAHWETWTSPTITIDRP